MSNDKNQQQNQNQNKQQKQGGGGPTPGITMYGNHSGGNGFTVRNTLADAAGYVASGLVSLLVASLWDKAKAKWFPPKQKPAGEPVNTAPVNNAPEVNEQELISIVTSAIEETGATSIADKGKVMGKIMSNPDNKQHGKFISEEVERQLNAE